VELQHPLPAITSIAVERQVRRSTLPRFGHSSMVCVIGRFDQEDCMPFVTVDVVPASGEEMPFKVVFKQGESVIAQWPVESKQAGEEEVLEVIKDLVEE
jgi:hypothetical protein